MGFIPSDDEFDVDAAVAAVLDGTYSDGPKAPAPPAQQSKFAGKSALTQAELEDVLREAGWDEKDVPRMSAIGMAEAALTPDGRAKIDSYNPGIGPGGRPTVEESIGPWQINMHPSLGRKYDRKRLARDPVYNAKAALDIYKEQGLRAWGAYTDGRYKKHYKKTGQTASAAAPFDPDKAVAELLKGIPGFDPEVAAPGPVTETATTLETQRQAARDPQSSRIGVLYTDGTTAPELEVGEYDVQLPNGQILRADAIKLTEYLKTTGATLADIRSGATDFTPLIGGKAEPTGEQYGTEGQIAVISYDEDGNELISSSITDPANIPVEAALQKKQFPGRKIRTEVGTAADVINAREPAVTEDDGFAEANAFLASQGQPQLTREEFDARSQDFGSDVEVDSYQLRSGDQSDDLQQVAPKRPRNSTAPKPKVAGRSSDGIYRNIAIPQTELRDATDANQYASQKAAYAIAEELGIDRTVADAWLAKHNYNIISKPFTEYELSLAQEGKNSSVSVSSSLAKEFADFAGKGNAFVPNIETGELSDVQNVTKAIDRQMDTMNNPYAGMSEADSEDFIKKRIKDKDYSARQWGAEMLANPLNWAFTPALMYNIATKETVSEGWQAEEKQRLKTQYGSFKNAAVAERYYQDMSWGETAMRFSQQTARSFAKNLIGGTGKTAVYLGQIFEDLTPVNALLSDEHKIGLRNVVNNLDFVTRVITSPSLEAAKKEMIWAKADNISKQQAMQALEEFDKAVGDDPVLKGRLLGGFADGIGSAAAFVALGALMPSLPMGRLGKFWGNPKFADSAVSGALQMGGPGYEEAKKAGLSESSSKWYGLWQMALGTTEAFGAGSELSQIFKGLGRQKLGLTKWLAQGVLEAGKNLARTGWREAKQEFAQEVFQTTAGNALMEYLKDQDPPVYARLVNALNRLPSQLGKAMTNEGLIALATGGLMGGGTALAQQVTQKMAGIESEQPPVPINPAILGDFSEKGRKEFFDAIDAKADSMVESGEITQVGADQVKARARELADMPPSKAIQAMQEILEAPATEAATEDPVPAETLTGSRVDRFIPEATAANETGLSMITDKEGTEFTVLEDRGDKGLLVQDSKGAQKIWPERKFDAGDLAAIRESLGGASQAGAPVQTFGEWRKGKGVAIRRSTDSGEVTIGDPLEVKRIERSIDKVLDSITGDSDIDEIFTRIRQYIDPHANETPQIASLIKERIAAAKGAAGAGLKSVSEALSPRTSPDQELYAVGVGEVTGDYEREFTTAAEARAYAKSVLSPEEPTAHVFSRTGEGFVDMESDFTYEGEGGLKSVSPDQGETPGPAMQRLYRGHAGVPLDKELERRQHIKPLEHRTGPLVYLTAKERVAMGYGEERGGAGQGVPSMDTADLALKNTLEVTYREREEMEKVIKPAVSAEAWAAYTEDRDDATYDHTMFEHLAQHFPEQVRAQLNKKGYDSVRLGGNIAVWDPGVVKEIKKTWDLTEKPSRKIRKVAEIESGSIPGSMWDVFERSVSDNVNGKAQVVPVAALVPTEDLDKKHERESYWESDLHPIVRAYNHISDAMEGVTFRRAPILVRRAAGGKFTIVDGHATVAALTAAGWADVPVIVIPEALARPANGHIAALSEKARTYAESQAKGYLKDVRSVAAEVGGVVPGGELGVDRFAVKSALSLERKLALKPNKVPTDLLRTMILLPAGSREDVLARVAAAIQAMADRGYRVVVDEGGPDVTNRFDNDDPGYKDFAIKFEKGDSDPLVRELQFLQPAMYRTKEGVNVDFKTGETTPAYDVKPQHQNYDAIKDLNEAFDRPPGMSDKEASAAVAEIQKLVAIMNRSYAGAYAEDSSAGAAANRRATASVASSSSTLTGEDSARDRTMPSAEGIDEVVQRNLSKTVLSSTERAERNLSASDIKNTSSSIVADGESNSKGLESQEKPGLKRVDPGTLAASPAGSAVGLLTKPVTKRAANSQAVVATLESQFERINDTPLAEMTNEQIVAAAVAHTRAELAWWNTHKGDYKGFYTGDIVEANKALKKWAKDVHGRTLSQAEVDLYHLVSAFGSPSADPLMDSSMGLVVFDRYLRTGELTGLTEKQATMWETNDDGDRVDTNELRFDENGDPYPAKVTVAYQADNLKAFDALTKKFEGTRQERVERAVEWLQTEHPIAELKAMSGKKTIQSSEYVSKQDGGHGIFAITGTKLGSYFLNRTGNLSTSTKDLWYARTQARYFGLSLGSWKTNKKGVAKFKPLVTPWSDRSKDGIRWRTLSDQAWQQVADENGMELAEVQQALWDFEKRLWEHLGHPAQDRVFVSQGLAKGIAMAAELVTAPPRMSATIGAAPLRAGTITKLRGAARAFGGSVYKNFLKLHKDLTKALDLTVNHLSQTVGVYGATSSNMEASVLPTVSGPAPAVRLYAALMGTLAEDIQHSVLISEYKKGGADTEGRIVFKTREAAESFVANRTEVGIEDLSYDPTTKTVILLDIARFGGQDFAALAEQYDEQIDWDKTQARSAEIEFLEEAEFAGVVAIARSEGHDRGGRGPKLSTFLDQAETKLRKAKLWDGDAPLKSVAPLENSLGIPRSEMPQIRREDHAEFIEFAKDRGVDIVEDSVPAGDLLPTQNEYNPEQAAQLPDSAFEKRLMVSSDNRVLDGHNTLVRLQEDPDQMVDIWRVDLPATEALGLMKDFPKVGYKTVGDVGPAATTQTDGPLKKARTAESKQLRMELELAYTSEVVRRLSGGTLHENGELELNEADAELLRRLIAERYFQRTGKTIDEMPFDGIMWNSAYMRNLAQFGLTTGREQLVEAGFTEDQIAKVENLLNKLIETADANEGHAIAYVYDEALPHERTHKEERSLGGVPKGVETKLLALPIAQTAGTAFDQAYPGISSQDKVSELAAIIATGDAAKHGLSTDPAAQKEFLRVWARGIIDNNIAQIDAIGPQAWAAQYPIISGIAFATSQGEQNAENNQSIESSTAGDSEAASTSAVPGASVQGKAGGAQTASQEQAPAGQAVDSEQSQPPVSSDAEIAQLTGQTVTEVKTKNRQFAQTLANNLFDVGSVEYTPQTVQGWQDGAAEIIEEQGLDAAIEAYHKMPAGESEGRKTALGVAVAVELYSEGRTAELIAFGHTLTENIGNAAQELRAAALMARLSPAFAAITGDKIVMKAKGRALTSQERDVITKLAEELEAAADAHAFSQAALAEAQGLNEKFEARLTELEKELAEARKAPSGNAAANEKALADALALAEEYKRKLDAGATKVKGPKALKDLRKGIEAERPDLVAMLQAQFPGTSLKLPAHHGTPHVFKAEILIEHPDGKREFIEGDVDKMPKVPKGAKVVKEFPHGRFKIAKLGTGEGHAAYGAGLYFASQEKIADWYREQLGGQQAFYDGKPVSGKIKQWSVDTAPRDLALARAAAIAHKNKQYPDSIQRDPVQSAIEETERARDYASQWVKEDAGPEMEARYKQETKTLAELKKLNSSKFEIKASGARYNVDLKPSEDEYLDWDVTYSRQSKTVQKALGTPEELIKSLGGSTSTVDWSSKAVSGEDVMDWKGIPKAEQDKTWRELPQRQRDAGIKEYRAEHPDSIRAEVNIRGRNYVGIADTKQEAIAKAVDQMTGAMIYHALSGQAIRSLNYGKPSQEFASNWLLQRGIKGNRYLDGDSRHGGAGSHNFVLFSDRDVAIESVLKSVPADLGIDPKTADALIKVAAAKLIDDVPTGLTPTAFDKWLNEITNNSLGAREIAVIHALAHEMTRPVFEPKDLDQKFLTKNRIAHKQRADRILIAEGLTDVTPEGIAEYKEAHTKQGPKKPTTFANRVLALGEDLGVDEQTITMAAAQMAMPDDKRLRQIYNSKFPDGGAKGYAAAMNAGKQLVDMAKDQAAAEKWQEKAGADATRKQVLDLERAIKTQATEERLKRKALESQFRGLKDTTTDQVLNAALDIYNLPRAVMFSSDVGFLLAQGLPTLLMHPTAWWKAVSTGIPAALTDKRFEEAITTLYNTEARKILEAGGTMFERIGNLADFNENFMSRVADMIPVVKQSNRAHSLTTDLFRLYGGAADLAELDAMYEAGKLGKDPDEAAYNYNRSKEFLAKKWVNVMSGKGFWGPTSILGMKFDASGLREPLAQLGSAPGYTIAAYQLAWYANPARAFFLPKGARKIMMKNSAKLWVPIVAMMLLLSKLGLINDDPEDKDFLQIDAGKLLGIEDMKINPMRALKEPMRLTIGLPLKMLYYQMTGNKDGVARIAKSYYAAFVVDSYGGMGSFWKSKLHPTISIGAMAITGKNFVGEPAGWMDVLPLPLGIKESYQAATYDRTQSILKTGADTGKIQDNWRRVLATLIASSIGWGANSFPGADTTIAAKQLLSMKGGPNDDPRTDEEMIAEGDPTSDQSQKANQIERLIRDGVDVSEILQAALTSGQINKKQATQLAATLADDLGDVESRLGTKFTDEQKAVLMNNRKALKILDYLYTNQALDWRKIDKAIKLSTPQENYLNDRAALAAAEAIVLEAVLRGSRITDAAPILKMVEMYKGLAPRMTAAQSEIFLDGLRKKALNSNKAGGLTAEELERIRTVIPNINIDLRPEKEKKVKPAPSAQGSVTEMLAAPEMKKATTDDLVDFMKVDSWTPEEMAEMRAALLKKATNARKSKTLTQAEVDRIKSVMPDFNLTADDRKGSSTSKPAKLADIPKGYGDKMQSQASYPWPTADAELPALNPGAPRRGRGGFFGARQSENVIDKQDTTAKGRFMNAIEVDSIVTDEEMDAIIDEVKGQSFTQAERREIFDQIHASKKLAARIYPHDPKMVAKLQTKFDQYKERVGL